MYKIEDEITKMIPKFARNPSHLSTAAAATATGPASTIGELLLSAITTFDHHLLSDLNPNPDPNNPFALYPPSLDADPSSSPCSTLSPIPISPTSPSSAGATTRSLVPKPTRSPLKTHLRVGEGDTVA